MEIRGISGGDVRKRVTEETREFFALAAYLFLCFVSLAYFKFALLQAEGVQFAPFAFAAGKALICAKFVLLGRALRVGERFRQRPLIVRVLYRSISFWLMLLALNVAEEMIVGLIHHKSIAEVMSTIGGGTYHQMIATSVVMLLILIPYFAFRLLGELIGEQNLFRLFFEYHRGVAETEGKP